MHQRCRYCVAANRPCERRHHRSRTLLVTVYPFNLRMSSKPRKPGFLRMAPYDSGDNLHLNIARLLSTAPRSLTPAQAEELLRKNNGNVRRAARDARRLAADDPRVVQPVPETNVDHPFEYKNLGHALNSCYIAATITACFANWDAWDALLSVPNGNSNKQPEILRNALRNVVNGVRLGKAVSPQDVEKLRSAMVTLGFPGGKNQEDATQFFSALVEYLDTPLVPLHEELFHNARRDQCDERLIAERLIWLSLLNEGTSLETLLQHAFFGERLEVRRRRRMSNTGQDTVDAWCRRMLVPEYTPSTLKQSGYLRGSFDVVTLPFALKRYGEDLKKRRTPIQLPLTLDFNYYVKPLQTPVDYTAHLKSVISHIGTRLGHGHYVSFTYDVNGWRKWDDMAGTNVELDMEAEDGLPRNRKWREEILRDSYLVLYELVPRKLQDTGVNEIQVENIVTNNSVDEVMVEPEREHVDVNVEEETKSEAEAETVEETAETEGTVCADEELAQKMENEEVQDFSRVLNDAEYARELVREEQVHADQNLARRIDSEANRKAIREDEKYAKQIERDEQERVDAELARRLGNRQSR